MQRIAIIGCGGSGKSTLATALGSLRGLPVQHLDRHFWRAGWVPTPKAQWQALQAQLCAEPAWIMDGNYSGSLELRLAAADTVIFLDLPTWVCLWAVMYRFLSHRGRSRPDMTEECPERLDWSFLWWICTYRKMRRPQILGQLQRCTPAQRVIILHSRRHIAAFLQGQVPAPSQ